MTALSNFAFVPLAQINWDPLFEDTGLPLAVMGLTVVFAGLILVRVFIGTLPRLMNYLEHFFPETHEHHHAAAPAKASSDEIPEETLAVIAAVVADVVGVEHRIVHTRPLKGDEQSYALEGRLQHHASHRIQPQNPR